MSNEFTDIANVTTSAQPLAVGTTAGAMLRAAREASGLHIAALAVAMKIPVKKLDALENDRLDLLHDAVFVRALASSVCRNFKLDPAPILAKLPSTSAPKLGSVKGGINAPFRAPSAGGGFSMPMALGKPAALIVIALLVGVLVVYFFPDAGTTDLTHSVGVAQETASKVEVTAATPTAVETGPSIALPVSNISVVEPAGTASGQATTLAGDAQGIKRPETIQGAGQQAADGPAAPLLAAASVATNGVLVLRAKAPSWVQVVDAKGTVVLSKTMAKDEVIAVPGTTPLSVVVGRADAVNVEVRGKPFALSEVSKDNVARFEVK